MPGSFLPTSVPVNALVALLAAASWGGGDFSGGMAVRVSGGGTIASLRVITVAHAFSLAVLLLIEGLNSAGLPHGRPASWALFAGAIAGLSIAAFYIALSGGAMGVAAAVSGLLAAAIPAVASAVIEGKPGKLQLAGFIVAGAAIWVIAAAPGEASPTSGNSEATPPAGQDREAAARSSANANSSRRTLLLAILGGFGFGVYFFLLKLANPLGVFAPAALSRVGSLLTCSVLLLVLRRNQKLSPAQGTPSTSFMGLSRSALRWALGVALLDTGGNLLYLQSTRLGRLDVAAVLASLYPAGTILLAALYLQERPTRQQIAGMALAGAAVVLVTI